jgi:hypothetical protein
MQRSKSIAGRPRSPDIARRARRAGGSGDQLRRLMGAAVTIAIFHHEAQNIRAFLVLSRSFQIYL